MGDIIRLILNKRFRRIILLFIYFVLQFWWINRLKRFLSQQALEQKYKKIYKLQARKFTEVAVELGGLLIKLGQFFSSRVDVLPQEYTDELSKLQDNVKPEEKDVIITRIKTELGAIEERFAAFSDTALAAASLGQVHLATLKTGEQVAVKVLRPGIEEVIDVDMQALKLILALAKRNTRINAAVDLEQIYQEFTSITLNELDYQKEGLNADAFRENFAHRPDIKIPQIYWNLSTKTVLTMEYVEGIKINEFIKLKENGLDLKKVAERLFSAYLEQIMSHGIFHADPHPGNILVDKEGRIILLDFGMVDSIESEMKNKIIDLAIKVYKKDAIGMVNSFDEMGFLRPQADKNTLIKSVKYMLANTFEDSRDITKLNIEELTNDLREMMYAQPFQIPAGTLFLGKALITVMGICNGLDNEFDIVNSAKPYVQNLFNGDSDLNGKAIIIDQAKKMLSDVLFLPEKISNFIDGIQSGEIRLQPTKSFENTLFEQQNQNSKKVIMAILTSGLILSGSILTIGGFQTIGITFFILGGFLTFKVLFSRNQKSQRRRHMKSMGSGFKRPKLHP